MPGCVHVSVCTGRAFFLVIPMLLYVFTLFSERQQTSRKVEIRLCTYRILKTRL